MLLSSILCHDRSNRYWINPCWSPDSLNMPGCINWRVNTIISRKWIYSQTNPIGLAAHTPGLLPALGVAKSAIRHSDAWTERPAPVGTGPQHQTYIAGKLPAVCIAASRPWGFSEQAGGDRTHSVAGADLSRTTGASSAWHRVREPNETLGCFPGPILVPLQS